MRIVLLGSPGSGKGTQGQYITERYNVCHLSTGDLLRQQVEQGTDLGQQAQNFMDTGQLVPDQLILQMITQRLNDQDMQQGFLLDGFPRNLPQAEALDQQLSQINQPLDVVIFIDVPRDEVIKRMLTRQRKDDNSDTVNKRLDVYQQATAPLVDYYRQRNQLVHINGLQPIDQVKTQIFQYLNEYIN